MKIPIVGIIAEYNPLHNGHLYQIQKAKESSKAEAVVVVLSSNFVQRGEPSILDKWNRGFVFLFADINRCERFALGIIRFWGQ